MAPLTILLSLLACNEYDMANGSYAGDQASEEAVAPNDYDEGDTARPDDEECRAVSSEPVDVYMSADDSNSQAQPVLVRQMIEDGRAIGIGEPRLYEFLNYYGFELDAPALGEVGLEPQLRYDAETETYSMLIAVVGHRIAAEDRRPVNLTFSVDTSGSMSGHPLDRIKDVLRAAASNMMAGDIVSIVTWNEDANVVMESVEMAGANDPRFLQAVSGMQSGGSTNLAKGLKTAYALAEGNFSEDRINRVVLMSDGGANTGMTDEELIAGHAEDGNGEGIYMLGVGAADGSYSDYLMDTVTDLGKGAYLYIDSEEEAYAMFTGDRFVTNTEIAARDVQLRVTLPGGYLISEFHGEELSLDPSEVEPQHLAPNDAMLYHQELTDCDADLHDGSEVFTFHVTFEDPETREVKQAEVAYSVDEMLGRDKAALLKADAIVAYAQAVFSGKEGEVGDALDLVGLALDAAPQDSDLQEIDQLLRTYRASL